MRDISSPLDGFSSPFGPQRNRTLQSLLFGQTEPGFTFEPWDITTLFQDRAGTTPVTAAGQSVGLRLDKSQGLRQGPELVTNGDFSAGSTGWTLGTDWSVSGGTANITGSGSNLSQGGMLIAGKTYNVTVTVSNRTSGTLGFLSPFWSPQVVITQNGTFSFILTAAVTTFFFYGDGSASIDNISVRELAGNHEVAVSDAKRGVYGWMPKTGKRNLLTYTEQFDNAAWLKGNSGTASVPVVTPNVATAPNGELTADLIQLRLNGATDGSYSWLYQNITVPSGATRASSFYVKAVTPADVGKIIRLTGTVNTSVTLTADWQRISNSALLVTGAAISVGIRLRGNEATADSVDLHIWGGQAEDGASATAYQRVVSQYDITEAGVPTCYYVQADGVDDAYVTPTITPNTDKVQVFAGVRKLVDPAATSIIIEHSTVTTNPGTFGLQAARTVAGKPYAIESGGSIPYASLAVTGSAIAPNASVIAATSDISGDLSTIRINGVQVGQSTADQGTGNYSAYPVYLYSRAGTTNPFNGLDFGHAVRFGPNLDAATIARVESLIARNTPEVTL